MTPMTHFDRSALRGRLDDIIDTHGLWPVLRALIARSFRRDPPVPPLGLNAHLRRDIGLEPLDEGGPGWDLLR
ncbi:hypothetical protein [Rhodobacter sp. SY28-1]|uniref:hypothetical protein n=1 Tax=Rhodobacter sp. SY28-1 TaxID=2562317 RepID=UPI0010BF9D3F|nr:hypothetical protein [Rhodobacter sp. SY28-1]